MQLIFIKPILWISFEIFECLCGNYVSGRGRTLSAQCECSDGQHWFDNRRLTAEINEYWESRKIIPWSTNILILIFSVEWPIYWYLMNAFEINNWLVYYITRKWYKTFITSFPVFYGLIFYFDCVNRFEHTRGLTPTRVFESINTIKIKYQPIKHWKGCYNSYKNHARYRISGKSLWPTLRLL